MQPLARDAGRKHFTVVQAGEDLGLATANTCICPLWTWLPPLGGPTWGRRQSPRWKSVRRGMLRLDRRSNRIRLQAGESRPGREAPMLGPLGAQGCNPWRMHPLEALIGGPDQLVGAQHIYPTDDAFAVVKGDGSVVTWGALLRAHTEPPSLGWRTPPVELSIPVVMPETCPPVRCQELGGRP